MTFQLKPDDLTGRGTVEIFAPPRGKKIGKLFLRTDADVQLAPARPYIVKDLFYYGEMGAAYGEPGTAKSFLMIYIARCISAGRSIFGRRVKATRTLYCALEGEGGFENRLKAAIEADGVVKGFAYIAQPLNLFSDASAQADLRDAIREHDAGFVVIDTFARALGEGSENDSADMGRMIQFLDNLRADTKAHICVVHHSGKDATRGMRGHSALLGAADIVLEVTHHEGANTRSVRVAKAKDAVDGAKYAFELRSIDLNQDDDGEMVTSCVVAETEVSAASIKPQRLTPELRTAYRELCDLFSMPGEAVQAVPKMGMSATMCVTKAQVKAHWIKTGRVDTETSKPDATSKAVQRLRNRLCDLGKIGMTDKHVWLVDKMDSGGP